MGCITCKGNYILVEGHSLNEIYCFQIIKYEKTKITFDIHELDLLDTTTLEESCLYFNKAIFYDQYKCITKPNKTYYIINNETYQEAIHSLPISKLGLKWQVFYSFAKNKCSIGVLGLLWFINKMSK